jgi:hypothetical protein
LQLRDGVDESLVRYRHYRIPDSPELMDVNAEPKSAPRQAALNVLASAGTKLIVINASKLAACFHSVT